MKFGKFKAVLWDLDDTLYSRRCAAKETFYGMFRENFYPSASDGFICEAVEYMMTKVKRNSMIHEDAFFALFEKFPPEIPYVRSRCVEYYYAHIVDFLVPFAEQFKILSALRARGIKTALVTNIQKEQVKSQRTKVERLGLRDLMDAIVISGEIGIHKPDRRIFEYAAEKLGVMPEECIFVGDDPESDIRGAIGAGMEAVWLDEFGMENLFSENEKVHKVKKISEYFSDVFN